MFNTLYLMHIALMWQHIVHYFQNLVHIYNTICTIQAHVWTVGTREWAQKMRHGHSAKATFLYPSPSPLLERVMDTPLHEWQQSWTSMKKQWARSSFTQTSKQPRRACTKSEALHSHMDSHTQALHSVGYWRDEAEKVCQRPFAQTSVTTNQFVHALVYWHG